MFTDLSNTLKCSYPFSLDTAESNARVGSSNLAESTNMFSFNLVHSVSTIVFLVKQVSSR